MLHWLTSSEFIAVKKIFAVKIHRSEIRKFTAFMSTRKRGFFSRKTLAKPFISVVFLAFLNVFLLLFGLDLVIRQLITWFLKRDFLEMNFLKSDFLKMKDFHISNWVVFIICWNTENMFQLVPIKTIKIVIFSILYIHCIHCSDRSDFEISIASSQWKKSAVN